jgi:hypothetical protein
LNRINVADLETADFAGPKPTLQPDSEGKPHACIAPVAKQFPAELDLFV